MKKKLLTLALTGMMVLGLAACGTDEVDTDSDLNANSGADVPQTVTISVKNASSEMIDLTVETNPTRVVFLDYVALDMCAALGILDDIEFLASQDSLPSHLVEYIPEGSPSLGGLKEYDMEAIMSFEPDIIFTSGRTAAAYDEFSKIAPTVCTSLDYQPSTWESFETLVTRNASIFGLSDEVADLVGQYEARLAAISEELSGHSVAITLFTGGSMTTLGNESRCSMIVTDGGAINVAADIDTTHGNTTSYEAMLLLDPEYIFVLDRDSAISAEGASTAAELLDNQIIYQTSAYQNDNIIYLTPDPWYLCEGGILAMDVMLSDLEQIF